MFTMRVLQGVLPAVSEQSHEENESEMFSSARATVRQGRRPNAIDFL